MRLTNFALGAGVLLGGLITQAATLKTDLVATGFRRPIFVTAPPGDTNRLFIAEQHTGQIRIFDRAANATSAVPFITISGVLDGNEQGLLGMAFHPQYSSNGLFYVNYTLPGGGSGGHTEVASYRATGDPATAATADPASKQLILSFNQPQSNHNGGWLGFGLDGYLYISSGDGGGGDDIHGPIGNAQSRTTLLGKILRIDVDGGTPYAIPESNPFHYHETYSEEIWAFGLRNPWRCSIDRETGDLWIGDVGQGAREEIDLAPAGAAGLNFGWRPREGKIQNPRFPNESPVTEATEPLHDYPRTLGVSVTGGYVYRGAQAPELQGKYLFADYGSGRIWVMTRDYDTVSVEERTTELNPNRKIRNPSSFGEDADGELYICDHSDGQIYRIAAVIPEGVRLSDPKVAGGEFIFSFAGAASKGYIVESRDGFITSGWTPVTNIAPLTANMTVSVTNVVSGDEQYFRVRTEP